MRLPGTRRSRGIAALVLTAVVAVSAAAYTTSSSGTPNQSTQPAVSTAAPTPTPSLYWPTTTEWDGMFKNLRPATPAEAQAGNIAIGELHYDPHAPSHDDTWVAKSDFHTVYTGHHMIIVVRSGVKWLGGPLGQVRLVFPGPNVIYDPFCRTYLYGYATLATCQATSAQRLAVSDNPLAALSDKAGWKYLDTNGADLLWGRTVEHLWYGTTEPTVSLVLPASPPPAGNRTREHVVELQPGQMITGGSFAGLTVLLPTTYKRYRNQTQFDLYHVEVDDPVTHVCNIAYGGIKSYFGPDVLQQYAQYCQS